jgi:hypothetical protein
MFTYSRERNCIAVLDDPIEHDDVAVWKAKPSYGRSFQSRGSA